MMEEDKLNKLKLEVYNNCVIYPKAQPKEIEREIVKVTKIFNKSSVNTKSEKDIVKCISNSLDVKQRIKQNGSWIKYKSN